ncbi:MAG: stage II sporulation protein P [Firmicutes bacterium]|nr:stage II sporulation protein P [Bacillota bacterium]
MARGFHLSVRGNRRFRQRSNGRGNGWLRILVALLLVVGVRYLYRQRVVPVATVDTAIEQENEVVDSLFSLGDAVYIRIVSAVIPGLRDVSQLSVPEGDAASSADKVLQGVVLRDLRDPKTIMFAQIPYLGIVPELLINKPNNGQTTTTPKITIPIRDELTGEGKVLIYHTHATESFVPSSGKAFISTDLTMTIAQLGEELADVLQRQYHIPVIHNKQIHDVPRTGAYEKALPTLEQLLTTYQDTELVVDLHRDGVAKEVTTATINGQATGRILFVVGTRYPNWEANLEKAQYLHNVLEQIAPGVSRGIRERPLVYNQNLHSGSLLIELGGYQNSLEEVRRTLPILAEALSQLYKSGQ